MEAVLGRSQARVALYRSHPHGVCPLVNGGSSTPTMKDGKIKTKVLIARGEPTIAKPPNPTCSGNSTSASFVVQNTLTILVIGVHHWAVGHSHVGSVVWSGQITWEEIAP